MKVILFANTDWYLYNFRRSLAQALRDAGHEVLLLSPPGAYADQLVSMGFRWISAPMERRSLNPVRELALLVWLYRLVKQEHVDLVHGFTIKCAVYGSLVVRLMSRSNRRPVGVSSVDGFGYVYTSHETKARLLRPVVSQLMRWALGGSGTRLILQNTDNVALCDRAQLVESAKVRLIRGAGVDCRRFSPKPDAEALNSCGRLRVLLAARLLWDKGLAEYVEAARQLRAQGRAIDFLLAGDPDVGNPAAVPEATVKGWVTDGTLQWLGHVNDMAALYATVHVVVLPSSYGEGLPTGLIEAGACGLPLVTTNAPGCREVVTDGVDGLLVPVKDASALAQAIARLQDEPALRQRLGQTARAKALAQFDERLVIQRTVAVYQELLGNPRTGPTFLSPAP